MPFVSEFIGKPVVDMEGKRLGRITDLVARCTANFPHPVIDAIAIQKGKHSFIAPYSAIAALVAAAIPLKVHWDEMEPYAPAQDDIFLARDVLDKQIIDTEGARVVRVNDVELVRANGDIFVGNVDVGGLGILRRLGLIALARRAAAWPRLGFLQSYISWDDVELLQHDQSMRLRVPVDKIHDLHPADIAEIISDLNRHETGQFLEALDMEHLADTLEEVEPEYQASLVENMPDEQVADILEEMEPDEAADLLAELPEERSHDLLELMEADEAADVRRLLTYPVESAGGLMTTEFASVTPDMTADESIQYLRTCADEAETIFYVYVTDAENHLVGVFSLSHLIFAPPEALVADFMAKRVVSVNLLDDQDEVAQVVSKYNLLAVPVVDEGGVIHGIVTADDALDKIIPTAWKKRLPRFFR